MKQRNTEPRRIALLVACAASLQLVENFIPQPWPGLKPGLANTITLIALVELGFRAALEIALLRALIASLVLGTFLGSAFMLSCAGALVSTLVMGALYRLTLLSRTHALSLVGISIAGALAHCLVQLALVHLLLLRHAGVWLLLPWLAMGAVVTGWFTGLIAGRVCAQLCRLTTRPCVAADSTFATIQPPAERLDSRIKILTVFALGAATLLAQTTGHFIGLLAYALLLVFLARVPAPQLLRSFGRILPLVIISLLVTGPDHAATAKFTGRVLLLTMGASTLTTTVPFELAQGLVFFFRPLRFLGVHTERLAGIIAHALTLMPATEQNLIRALKTLRANGARFHELLPAMADVLVESYVGTDQQKCTQERSW